MFCSLFLHCGLLPCLHGCTFFHPHSRKRTARLQAVGHTQKRCLPAFPKNRSFQRSASRCAWVRRAFAYHAGAANLPGPGTQKIWLPTHPLQMHLVTFPSRYQARTCSPEGINACTTDFSRMESQMSGAVVASPLCISIISENVHHVNMIFYIKLCLQLYTIIVFRGPALRFPKQIQVFRPSFFHPSDRTAAMTV